VNIPQAARDAAAEAAAACNVRWQTAIDTPAIVAMAALLAAETVWPHEQPSAIVKFEGELSEEAAARFRALWAEVTRPQEPPKRDPASTTSGEFGRAPAPAVRHQVRPAFGIGKDVTG
jgi:hypothetical protein